MYSRSSSFPSEVFTGPLRSPLGPLGGILGGGLGTPLGGAGTAAELNSVPDDSYSQTQQDSQQPHRMTNIELTTVTPEPSDANSAAQTAQDAGSTIQNTLRDLVDTFNEVSGNSVSSMPERPVMRPPFTFGPSAGDTAAANTPNAEGADADAPKQEPKISTVPANADTQHDDVADSLNGKEFEEGQRKLLEMIDNISSMVSKKEVLAKNMEIIMDLKHKRYTNEFIAEIFQQAFNFRSPITAEDIERAAEVK